jgi:hypothetical protein
MANEINLNLEKLDILQVHANKQLILEAQETTSLLSKGRHSKPIYKCRVTQFSLMRLGNQETALVQLQGKLKGLVFTARYNKTI